MARKRFLTPSFKSTRGHSVATRWSSPSARFSDDTYVPYYHHRHFLDTSGEENAIRRNVNKELILTSNFIDDSYDMAAKSRNRDQEVLRDATRAIPPSMSTNEPMPTSGLKASAPPKPFRRFQTADNSCRGTLPQDQKGRRGLSVPPSYRLSSNVIPGGSQVSWEWASPAAQAMHRARKIRDSVRLECGGSLTSSPCESPRESPDRELGDDGRGRSRRPRSLESRQRFGRHFSKLLQQRAKKPPERDPRYNIYYDDDDDIESETTGGEYVYERIGDEDYEGANEPGECFYIVQRDRSPTPEEYVPFAPKHRISHEDDNEGDGYKSSLADLSSLSITPYKEPSGAVDRSVADDVTFYNIVAETAAKARKALGESNLDEYDNASLVLSVEGEYTDPEKGDNLGFQYIARPLQLKGPMLATGPGTYAAAVGTDSAFDKYFKNMQLFREEIRARLESGYRALRAATTSYKHEFDYHKALPSSFSHSHSHSSYPSVSYRKRLEDGSEDHLVVYPLSKRATSPALSLADEYPDKAKTVAVYECGDNMKLSTLDKIKIKVDSETYHNPKAEVASRRARSQPPTMMHATQSVLRTSRASVPPPSITPSRPYVRRSHREAALVGSNVDVHVPHKKRPKSKYAASVIREINIKKHWEAGEGSPVESDIPTSHLHASPRPVSATHGRHYEDDDIIKPKPNDILSWKHRLQSRVAPEVLLYQPRVYDNVRSQLRNVQEKMDRHRQLMDRYLDAESIPYEKDIKTKIMAMYSDMQHRDPVPDKEVKI